MKDLRKISERIEAQFASKKIKKFSYNLVTKEKRELSAENGEFSLLRTLFDNTATVSAYKAGKNGVVQGNDFSDAGIDALVESAVLSADSAMKDTAHDISPEQEAARFRQGVLKPDFDRFFERIKELLQDIRNDYPKIQIMNVIGEYDRVHSLFRNSNGVDFEDNYGLYSFMIEFSGHEGDKTTSIDACGVQTKSLDTRFIDMGNVRSHLDDMQKQLDQIQLAGKFTGSVILNPELFAEFLMMVQNNYLSDAVLIDGTSLWKKKLGKKVADEKLTFTLKSHDKRIAAGERITADGFRTEDVPVIEKGILKNFTIGIYAAKKTKRQVTRNSSHDYVINPGKTPLEEMIKSVKKGLIVGGFSGGRPSTNGEFSGVAKNSFYIENGEIKGAVSEVMINGNLGKALAKIRALSKELLIDGSMVAPYALIDGIVVSGK